MNYYAKDLSIKDIILRALKEDIGKGDITTKLFISEYKKAQAVIIAKEKGIVCGIDIAKLVFKLLDRKIRFSSLLKDGDMLDKGKIIARLHGSISNILTGERVALNFLGFLSGIATRTKEFVSEVKLCNVKLLDTRKTIPGLRELEKYAVRVGGGFNHRLCLDEMILIKENHIKVMGLNGVTERIKAIRKGIPSKIKIEIEVNNLKQFRQVLKVRSDIIMLDNMTLKEIKEALKLRNRLLNLTTYPLPRLEVSGNINLDNINNYALTGIDFISLGTLTKDIKTLDISLEVIEGGK